MRIIVTGANGFVGVHVVRGLLGAHEVMAIDNLRYGPWRFTAQELRTFKSDTTDLRERARVEVIVGQFAPQAIIHLAAIHFIPECERLPDEAVSINTQATVNLLSACPPKCRFVYTSTAAVYAPIETAHREGVSPIGPMDVYGFTKLHGEDFVRYFTRQRSLQSVIVRLFNVIGPGETNPHVLPEIIKQLKGGSRTLRLGNIHPMRDYIYVGDVAEGFIATAVTGLCDSAEGDPVIVNLGSGKSYSVQEVVDNLSAIIGERIIIKVDSEKVRKSDRPQLLADNSRMSGLFGWTPKYDLDRALRKVWDNPDFSN